MKILRRVFQLLSLLLFSQALWAASPSSFTYEGILNDSSGNPVDLTGQTITFSIIDGSNCVVYQETSSAAGDANGLISHAVGTGTITYGTFSTTLFNSTQTGSTACTVAANATRYLKVSIASPSVSATVNLTSVPYALEASAVGGYTASSILRTDSSVSSVSPLNNTEYNKLLALIAGTSSQYVQQSSPVFTGVPQFSGAPTGSNDLTNKSYVDTVVSTAVGTLNLSGDVTGAAGSTTLSKVQTKPLSISGLAARDILQFNGTGWVNRNIPACGGGQYLTFNGSAYSCANDISGVSGGSSGDVYYNNSGIWSAGTPNAAGLVDLTTAQSIFGNKVFTGSLVHNSTGATQIAAGVTGQQPGSPSVGMIRINTTIGNKPEYWNGSTWVAVGSGNGTVSSVGISGPSQLFTSGGAVTSIGTLSLNLNSQGQNKVFAGPVTGGSGTPSFRSLDATDITAGTLPISRGGTGVSSFAISSQLGTDSTGALKTFGCSTGQLLATSASVLDCYNLDTLGIFKAIGNAFGTVATVGTTDPYPLKFITANTSRMLVDTTGRVLIGMNSPLVSQPDIRLQVTGQTQLDGQVWVENKSADYVGTQTIMGITHRSMPSSKPPLLQFAAARANETIAIGSGEIIGQIDFDNPVSGWGIGARIAAKTSANGWSNTAQGSVLEFATNSDSPTYLPTTRMVIDQNGNVGIGTTNPSYPLEVSGSTKLGSAGVAFQSMGGCTLTSISLSGGSANAKTCSGIPAGAAVSCSPTTSVSPTITWSAWASAANTVSINVSASLSAITWRCMWMVP